MEIILEKLKKFDTPLVWGIASAVFGVCFILLPEKVLDILLLITGIHVIALAVLRLISLLTRPSRTVSFIISVVINAIVLLFGITLATARSGYAYSICTTLGAYLGVLSLFRLVTAHRVAPSERDKNWWINTAISITMLVMGLWLVIYPVWPKILAGVALLVLSAEFLLRAKGHIRSGMADAARDVFEGSFTDRSDR